jgi:hypothetical protein
MFSRIMTAAKMALAFPLYQIRNLVAYAGTRQGWPAKIGALVAFLPIIAFTTAIWAAGWTVAMWAVWRLVK